MEDVNSDQMIDRPVYSDRVCVTIQQSGPVKTQLCDVIVLYVPKLASSSTKHSKVCTFPSPKELL